MTYITYGALELTVHLRTAGPRTIRSNSSQVMVTWDPHPPVLTADGYSGDPMHHG